MSAAGLGQLGLFGGASMLRDSATPVVGQSVITPRPYQREQHAAVNRELQVHRSTLVVGATGTGKTVLLAMQGLEHAPMLVLAQELAPIKQAAQKLRHVVGKEVAIEKADQRAWVGAEYVVASVHSLRGERLQDFKRRFPFFSRIAVDEAHHAMAETYVKILGAYPGAKVFGLTATPDRGDGKAPAMVFETVAHTYGLYDAIRDGWLARLEWRSMDVSGVSLDRVGLRGGDLDQDELDKETAQAAAEIARSVVQHCKEMRTIVFCPGVETARVAAQALNELQPGCARAIYGALDDDEKERLKAAHQRGDFPYLLTCQMLIEAYDDPCLRCVVDLAKTKSRARFAQKPGRVTRPWPFTVDGLDTAEERRAAIAASPKPAALFFDANYGKHGHKLANAGDLLGGVFDERVRKMAAGLLEERGGGDVVEAMEEAKAAIQRRDERQVRRIAARAAKATGDVLIGSPLTDEEMFGESVNLDTETRPFDLPGWLVKQGIQDAHSLPVERQKSIRRAIIERKKQGLGSVKQVRHLKRLGVPERDAKAMTGRRCGFVIGTLKGRAFNPARDGWLLGAGTGG